MVRCLTEVRHRVTRRGERGEDPLPEDGDADEHHEHRRDEVEPGIEILGDDELREPERHESEREDADRVRHGDDRTEKQRVARAPARPHEVRRHDRLPVPRRERVGSAPEHRHEERERDHAERQLLLLDQAREAALGGGWRTGGGRLRGTIERRRHHVAARCEPRLRGSHVEWARNAILRIGAEAPADPAARRGRRGDRRSAVGADHELAPAESLPVDLVAQGHRVLRAATHGAGGEDELEARRAETRGARGEREPALDGDQTARPAVDGEDETGRDRLSQPIGVPHPTKGSHVLAGLERRDLGEVENVVDVGAVAGEDDLRIVVRREVAERVCSRDAGGDECRDRSREDDREALHAAPSPPASDRFGPSARAATGAQRIEKLASSASALRYHVRIAGRSPAHPAAYPRWK